MKIVVAHHLWSRVGGGELVNAYAVKAMLERGHHVAIVSSFGFDKKKYQEWFGIDLKDVKVYRFLPKMLPLFGIYQRLGISRPLRKAIKREKPEIVFIDNELYKPILKLKREKGFKLLEYIHFPFHALKFQMGLIPDEYKEAYERYVADAKVYHRKYEKGLWKIYFKVWLKLYDRVARENPFEAADLVMTNSHYIAKLTKMLWSGDPYVLHPPVKVNDFLPFANRDFEEREDTVVMIGRIAPEKRIEDVIDALALTETKPTLKVVGGLIPTTIPYRDSLLKRAEEKGVRVEFHTNVPREELVKIAVSSKLFVHSTVGEHFGIAVVEGMASGCPVIVHKSGGPYEDIIGYGEYGLAYETVEELAENIDKLMASPKTWRHYHEKSLSRAPTFSEETFKQKLIKVVEDA